MAENSRFCSACGSQLVADARFCHSCGRSVKGAGTATTPPTASTARRWVMPAAVIAAVAVLGFVTLRSSGMVTPDPATATPGMTGPPDISAMSPQQRADRLFNRVMQYWSNGQTDSAAFFAPMARAALADLRPVTAHVRYDIGLIALAQGDAAGAAAQSDSILAERPTHLLGLSLAARAAEARRDTAAARSFRERMLAAEQSELSYGLVEYSDHDSDIRDALNTARSR